jgi:hypothetical protein
LATTANQRAIQTALDHLARFAFYRRDNPFLTSRATFDLSPKLRRELETLLDGTVDPDEWAKGEVGSELLATIRIGSVPRDLQLVAGEDDDVVAVKDVFAFFHARLFWWLVTILWTIEVAPAAEPLLGEGIKSFRFRSEFLSSPATSGVMFQDQGVAHTSFKRFPMSVAKENAGELLTAATFDLRAFYYSVERSPAQIISNFFAAKGSRVPRSRRLRVLNELMELAHRRYAEVCADVKPRGEKEGQEGARPLPLGPPSSQLLANMVMSLIHDDLRSRPGVIDVCSYVDDTVIISDRRPELEQPTLEFLADLGVVTDSDHHRLTAPSADALSMLRVTEEKCGLSFLREPKRDSVEEGVSPIAIMAESALEQWEIYVEGEASSSRPGPRETLLHAPLTRERVPRKLKEDILDLLEQVRIGMSGTDTAEAFNRLIGEIDKAQFIRLRPYWADLAVVAIAAHGVEAVRTLTAIVRDLCETLEPPPESSAAARDALLFGLRESWRQALAQALAAATDSSQRATLLRRIPRMRLDRHHRYSMRSVVQRARRIRRRRLIPREHVAVPLAEFSDWQGKLIGPGAFVGFLDWSRDEHPGGQAAALAKAVRSAMRFVRLHEACLAIHLWGGSGPDPWIDETFAVLGAQPLIHQELVEELHEKAIASLGSSGRGATAGHRIRIAMPGVPIAEDQLEAVISKDSQRLWQIASASRRTVREIAATAGRKKANLLVLPEWSVMADQLSNLMVRASAHRMLVIAGQAPEIAGGRYWNRLWTGIPLQDRVGHRACLVPPPRQKSFLSPKEKALIDARKIPSAPASKKVQTFSWRGMLLASLLCFEFADLNLRQEVRFKTDILTVSSLNHDWHYFDAIQEATTRDNYCLTVCVNTGSRPGTRIARPTRHEMAIAASIHGSDDLAVITRRIDMEPIVAAQIHQLTPQDPTLGLESPSDDASLSDYKPFPPA